MILLTTNAWPSEVDDLTKKVDAEPENVDTRLQLAFALSRVGKYEEAEKHARIVTYEATSYLDAYLLLARMAGWQGRYGKALAHLQSVLIRDPANREALLLKLDVLIWRKAWKRAKGCIQEMLRHGYNDAELYYRWAQVDLAEKRTLLAYRHAKRATDLDPSHAEAAQIVQDTKRVTLFMTHELEYYGFEGEGAASERWGYGLRVAAKAFAGSRWSATLLDTFRYRYRTTNNLIGLELNARPVGFLQLTARGLVGFPAEVIPKAKGLISARFEIVKVMDAAITYGIDVLPWPEKDPALFQRTEVEIGILAHKRVRINGSYTMGLLSLCNRDSEIKHIGRVGIDWTGNRVAVGCFYGFAQESDPYSVGQVAPATCAEIAAVEAAAQTSDNSGVGYYLINLDIHAGGIHFSVKATRKLTIKFGYRAEMRGADTNNLLIPAHIGHLGLMYWL